MTARAAPDTGPAVLLTPSLRRRLGCFVYEGVLLFGVVVVAGLVYGITTQQRHALVGTVGLRVFLFAVLGLYFVWFWTRSGQTLAMQTWQIKLVTRDGRPLTHARALARYLLAWLWFLPALAAVGLAGLQGGAITFGLLAAGVAAYAALTWLHPDRQYFHDAVCRTRLVGWTPPPRHATAR